jgi:hypothetical protein
VEAISQRRGETMSASEAVYVKVAEVLVQALNVDDDEIKPSATLLFPSPDRQGWVKRHPSLTAGARKEATEK